MRAVEPDPAPGGSEGERAAVTAAAVRLGLAAAPPRHALLSLLHAVQEEYGWLSRGCLAAVAARMGVPFPEVWGVASFYALFRTSPHRGPHVAVCDDVGCLLRGAGHVVAALEQQWGPPRRWGGDAHAPEVMSHGDAARWEVVPCLGLCDVAPAATVDGVVCARVDADTVIARAEGEARPSSPAAARAVAVGDPRLLRRVLAGGGATTLAAHAANGGGRGLARARETGADAVIRAIEAARLLGRGGAAFPAALKWRAVAAAPAPRWVVANGDESEPGTFKDRVLMERDPFAVLEGLLIAAWCVDAEDAAIYVRGEYLTAHARLAAAIAEAEAAGQTALRGGRRVRIRLVRGAGAYVCGEETALFNSIEGRRGEPRNKPPFPAASGLDGRPTLVHNVETLAQVAAIAAEPEAAGSTKLFCVSGHVRSPGVVEAPFGTPLRDVVAAAGGMRGPAGFGAVLCGGASGRFLGPSALDVPLSHEGLREAGASLGSGALIVLEAGADLHRLVLRIARFFRDESCGQCVPCRIGTQRQLEIVERWASGAARPDDGELWSDLAAAMADASICGLGQTASQAALSGVALAGWWDGGTGG